MSAEKKNKLFHFLRKGGRGGGDEKGEKIIMFFAGKVSEKVTFGSKCKQEDNIKLTLGKSVRKRKLGSNCSENNAIIAFLIQSDKVL